MDRQSGNAYEDDIVAWAREQVFLLRSGQLPLIDIDHIVVVIEQLAADSQQARARRHAGLPLGRAG